jgi:DNA-binding MarR family transcriptional regulator
MAVLGCLFRNGGELSIGSLAQQERVQPPSMTRTVNCLEQDGYVERRSSDSDGRQVLVALSEQGRQRLLADRDRRDAWLTRRLEELSPDERRILRAATPVLARLAGA